jgi:hypothetical protein
MTPAEQQKLEARAEREAAWRRRRKERDAAIDRDFWEAIRRDVALHPEYWEAVALQEARKAILQWVWSRAFPGRDHQTTGRQ